MSVRGAFEDSNLLDQLFHGIDLSGRFAETSAAEQKEIDDGFGENFPLEISAEETLVPLRQL